MLRGETVKNTLNINALFYEEIKELVKEEKVKSFTEFINEAIEFYLKDLKRKEYARKMKEASEDKEFIKRTMECQNEFDSLDSEVDKKW